MLHSERMVIASKLAVLDRTQFFLDTLSDSSAKESTEQHNAGSILSSDSNKSDYDL